MLSHASISPRRSDRRTYTAASIDYDHERALLANIPADPLSLADALLLSPDPEPLKPTSSTGTAPLDEPDPDAHARLWRNITQTIDFAKEDIDLLISALDADLTCAGMQPDPDPDTRSAIAFRHATACRLRAKLDALDKLLENA